MSDLWVFFSYSRCPAQVERGGASMGLFSVANLHDYDEGLIIHVLPAVAKQTTDQSIALLFGCEVPIHHQSIAARSTSTAAERVTAGFVFDTRGKKISTQH